MVFFLPFALLTLSTVRATPAHRGAVCSDGTAVTDAVCCDFIPASFFGFDMNRY